MMIHATAVARNGRALILIGAPRAGKSDLALRLLDRGFILVGDDQVLIDGLTVRPTTPLAGLIEVRGLGILRVPHCASAKLALALALDAEPERLPRPLTAPFAPIPLLPIEGRTPSAAFRAELAFECALGLRTLSCGGICALDDRPA